MLTIGPVEKVAQLTGPGSVSATDRRWDLYGADLGHMFWHEGSLYMVFGDSYGPGRGNWRSNTMARIATPDPATGLPFASMVTGPGGAAAELLPSLKVDGVEHTVIPTAGVSVGRRMVLHYMSVRRWVAPGRWDLNSSGLAYSDDGGVTWIKDPLARWPGGSNFGQAAMVPVGDTVYVFGIPAGRFGKAVLARVPAAQLLTFAAWRYWDGSAWTADPGAAATVVPAPVGELSVRWSPTLGRWLMLYLDEQRGAVVLRTAPGITGPWGPEQVVTTAATFPELYAPYLVPVDTGADVYFTMSQNALYEVFLMKVRLGPLSG
jgi:D-arabinan endo alpha-(1,5)-arabinofuranosidase